MLGEAGAHSTLVMRRLRRRERVVRKPERLRRSGSQNGGRVIHSDDRGNGESGSVLLDDSSRSNRIGKVQSQRNIPPIVELAWHVNAAHELDIKLLGGVEKSAGAVGIRREQ